MNWYRNAHYFLSNQVKKYFHELCGEQIKKGTKRKTIKPKYKVYLKNKRSDGPNVRSVMEKFILDALVENGVIEDDRVDIVIGDSSEYFIDEENPRIEFYY